MNKKLEISDHLAELNSKLSVVEKVNSKVGVPPESQQ
jgi:hypothetical protein